MILVTGATGYFGNAVIEFLLKKGVSTDNIAALVRDPTKSEALKHKGIGIRIGEYDDPDSLLAAFKGVDKLLFVSGNEIMIRGKQHENTVKAAAEAGVKHIVYTSFERKNETGTSPMGIVAAVHIQTEKEIKAGGMAYTILRNNFYMDVLPLLIGDKVLETGIFLPAGDGKAAYATRLDMAEAAANILIGKGHEGKEYIISSDVNYSLEDVATILSELSGKQVTYTSPAKEVFIETLSKSGISMEMVQMVTILAEAIKQNELYVEKTDLGMLLGRKPTTMKSFLKTTYML